MVEIAKTKASENERREPYHHGDLRAHLIETVRQLVEEKGADGFSISEAARRAGVSSAAPYRHFHDRTEIVRAVALEGMLRLGKAMEVAAANANFAEFKKINAIGKAYVDFARNEPGVFRLMFGLTEGHRGDPEMEETGRKTYGVLVREVTASLPPDTAEEEVWRRSYMLWTFVHGHSFLQIDEKVHVANIQASEDLMLADLSKRILGH